VAGDLFVWEFGDASDAPTDFGADASGNTTVGSVVLMPPVLEYHNTWNIRVVKAR